MNDLDELGPLFGRACSGDQQALSALLGKLRDRVRLRAGALLGQGLGRRIDASDVAQEVCLRVHRAFGQLNGQTVPQLLGWVEEILRNVLADCHKRHAAGKRDAGREVAGDNLFPGVAADVATPSAGAVRAEREARLGEALQRLPEAQRRVFELRFRQQLPFAAVAGEVGVSVGNARVLFLRAVERLRRELGDET